MNFYFSDTETKTIVEIAQTTNGFSKLVAAVTAAKLVETLNGEGPFTVFAPNDDAFAKIKEEELADLLKPDNAKTKLKPILMRHVVGEKSLDSASIPVGLTVLKTAGGEDIMVANTDKVRILSSAGTATVIQADIKASNGVIHVVDTIF